MICAGKMSTMFFSPSYIQLFFGIFFGILMLFATSSPATAAELLPDLQMASLRDFQIEKTDDGRKLLRFTAIIVNTGNGPFEVFAERDNDDVQEMQVIQGIYDESWDDYYTYDTDTVMYWATDGHNHWHVKDMQSYEVTKLNGKKPILGIKGGFCFWDNHPINRDLPGAPWEGGYIRNDEMENPSCGRETDLEVTMGLSIGWGDEYPYFLDDQYIDITKLKNGKYRLTATADKENWFIEKNEENNATWVEFKLKGDDIKVFKYGPSADPED